MTPPTRAHLRSHERYAIDLAVRRTEQRTRLEFSVFLGGLGAQPRDLAAALHGALVAPARSVLIAVDPAQRRIEVITGSDARRRLADKEVSVALVHAQDVTATCGPAAGVVALVSDLAVRTRPRGSDEAPMVRGEQTLPTT